MALPFLPTQVCKGKDQKDYLRKIISDTLTLLCKNALQFDIGVTIEGLLGITVDNNEIFLVNINEQLNDTNEKDSNSNEENSGKKILNKSQLPPLIPLKRIKNTPKKRKRSPSPPQLEIEHPPEDEPCLGDNAVSEEREENTNDNKTEDKVSFSERLAIKEEPIDAGYEAAVATQSQAVFPEPQVQSVTGAATSNIANGVGATAFAVPLYNQPAPVQPTTIQPTTIQPTTTTTQQDKQAETDENGFEIVMDEQGQMHLKPRKIIRKPQELKIVAPLPAENQFTPSISLQVLPTTAKMTNAASILGTILQGKEPFNQTVQSCSFVKTSTVNTSGTSSALIGGRKQLRPLKIRPIMTIGQPELQNVAPPPVKKTMFECRTCGKLLGNKKTLSRHQMLHLGRRFTCGICGHAYTRKDNLARHYLTRHETEMPADIKPVIIKEADDTGNSSMMNDDSMNDESMYVDDPMNNDESMNIDESHTEGVSFGNSGTLLDNDMEEVNLVGECVDEGEATFGDSEEEEEGAGNLLIDEEGEQGGNSGEEEVVGEGGGENGGGEEDESEYEETEDSVET